MQMSGAVFRWGRPDRRRLTMVTLGSALVIVVGCSPAPVVRPSPVARLTPPPPRAEVETWPAVVWSGSDLDDPPVGYTSEHAAAVAGSNLGFVAVGVAEAPVRDLERGSVWYSKDGSSWRRAAAGLDLDGVSLVDVAATDGAFVAVGTIFGDRELGKQTRTVVIRSTDGRTWTRLPDDPSAPEAYSGAVAANPHGFLATSFTLAADGLVIGSSQDGQAWRTLPPTAYDDASSGISAPYWTGQDWVAAGVRFGSPVILHSRDGGSWAATRLEPPADDGDIATDVFAGPWGAMAVGIATPSCPATAPCAGGRVSWWSSDGASWGRTTDTETAIEQGLVVGDGDRGVISVSGLDAWSSPDGWHWRQLGQPGLDTMQVNDATVLGDVIVAVGDSDREDGSTYPTFLIAGPPLILTN